jgi:hypothetical protein
MRDLGKGLVDVMVEVRIKRFQNIVIGKIRSGRKKPGLVSEIMHYSEEKRG